MAAGSTESVWGWGGHRGQPLPVLRVHSLNTVSRAEPQCTRTAQGRPSCAGGLGPDPWSSSAIPSSHSGLEPFSPFLATSSVLVFIWRWLSQRVRNAPLVPATWHPGFGSCAVLSYSVLAVFILNLWLA